MPAVAIRSCHELTMLQRVVCNHLDLDPHGSKGATAGATLTLRLQEMKSATVVGSATATVALSTSWQLITVSYTVSQSGKTSLDFNAFVNNVPARTTGFYADDAVITLG